MTAKAQYLPEHYGVNPTGISRKVGRLMERVLAPANPKRAHHAWSATKATCARLSGLRETVLVNPQGSVAGRRVSPSSVPAVDIPKPKGGTRQLGIPNVVDRLIQKALLQQLTPIIDPELWHVKLRRAV